MVEVLVTLSVGIKFILKCKLKSILAKAIYFLFCCVPLAMHVSRKPFLLKGNRRDRCFLYKLDNEMLSTIISIIPNFSRADLNCILNTSKRFNELVLSDVLWNKVLTNERSSDHWTNTVWLGRSKDGSEEKDEWLRIKDDSGLPIMNMLKVRWMSHNTSRLKIFYGALSRRTDTGHDSVFSMFAPANNSVVKRKIVVLGYGCRENNATKQSHKLMQQMHYIVPESATVYHLNSKCKPLLKGFVLTDIESSPITSRSRNILLDPGSRIETHIHHNLLQCRRIGDERLTFVEFEYTRDKLRYKQEQYSEIICGLFNKSIGNIIVVEYHACPDDQLLFEPLYREQELQKVEAHLSCLLNVVLTRSAAECQESPTRSNSRSYSGGSTGVLNGMSLHWPSHSTNGALGDNTPLLIFLSVELTNKRPTTVVKGTLNSIQVTGTSGDSASSTSRDSRAYADHIHNLVSSVNSIMNRLMTSHDTMMSHNTNKMHSCTSGRNLPYSRAQHHNRQWYVQPIDAHRSLNNLRCGVFAGVNWLLRAINTQNA